jgi:hypothetical protein
VLSGANSSNNPNKYYRLALSDGHLIGMLDQPTTSLSGIRDLAVLGDRLYGSENDTLWSMDATLLNRQVAFRNLYLSPIRALAAQYSSTNSPTFYIGDLAQPIRKLSNTGTLISTYNNNRSVTGIACGPNAGDPVWTVSTDGSQLWISKLNDSNLTVQALQQFSIPSGYSSTGACLYTDPTTGAIQIAVLLVNSVNPVHAYLRFYVLPSTISYATTTAQTGTLAANDSIAVPVHVTLDTTQSVFYFYLKQINSPGVANLTTVVMRRTTSVQPIVNSNLPKEFSISPSYPNPFNSTTEVRVTMPISGKVTVRLYDVTGRIVQERTELLTSGQHTMQFSMTGFAAGSYFAEFRLNNQSIKQHWVYLK